MQLPKELTTVTPVSKTIALFLFIALPIIAFLFGMRYQTLIEQARIVPAMQSPTPFSVGCTLDAKLCPDGTSVGRIPPKCDFEACPITPTSGAFCGGITGQACPAGTYCEYDGNYPDAGGICIKNGAQKKYICPRQEFVNCMPSPDKAKGTECTAEFLQWALKNCPNFKGAAY